MNSPLIKFTSSSDRSEETYHQSSSFAEFKKVELAPIDMEKSYAENREDVLIFELRSNETTRNIDDLFSELGFK